MTHASKRAASMAVSPPELDRLIAGLHPCSPEQPMARACHWRIGETPEHVRYANEQPDRGIAFSVEDNPFEALSALDPRVVRIAPGACNEKHRHAHESLFVVLSGSAELEIGNQRQALEQGEVACVPRWVVHQTHNRSAVDPLVLLAITDFGLTSAALGNYDKQTRLNKSEGNT